MGRGGVKATQLRGLNREVVLDAPGATRSRVRAAQHRGVPPLVHCQGLQGEPEARQARGTGWLSRRVERVRAVGASLVLAALMAAAGAACLWVALRAVTFEVLGGDV